MKMGLDDLVEFIEKGGQPKQPGPSSQSHPRAITDGEDGPRKKNRRKKNKKKTATTSDDPSTITDASEKNPLEAEDEEEEDEEFMKFQKRMEEMHQKSIQNQQEKISFDGQWIDSLKQRL